MTTPIALPTQESTSPTAVTSPVRRVRWWGSGSAWRDGLLAWPVPLLLFASWWVAAEHGWVPPQVLPPPEAVWTALLDSIASGDLQSNLLISLQRVLGGFAVGLAGGLLLGVAMGLSPTVNDYVFPLFKAFSQVPVLGWLPLLMLLVGIDEALKILLISKAALVPVTLNTVQGIRSVPTRLIEVGRVLGFTRWQMLSRVVFPAAVAPIWNGIRYGLTHAWLALVVVELLASSEGLGFMIVYGRQLFQLDVVMAAVVIVGVAGYLLDKVLAAIETRLLRWRKEAF
ncbi:MAG: ABC transporter permease [Sphaerotilus natans subsp. sulfidivorans]|uniref:ABC transporter permease n=1 Tax=Sphaerotilus sulfidivorans TaxID=639200 RepID=UPI0023555F38|nr:ABC transporter permease [Sphaerotilus sulfidivorans]MCK6403236.1 ABC transporter permease [Sphaerotilus sulfidivorans]